MSSHDVIFTFATETWDDAVARGMSMSRDRLARRVLDDERIGRRLIANAFRSPAQRAARQLRQRPRAEFPDTAFAGLVTPLRWRRDDPLDVGDVSRSYQRYDRQLAAAARRRGLHEPRIITSNPFVAAFCTFDWAGPVTLYVTDDWAAYSPRQAWWPAYHAAYAAVRRRRRRVCAVSTPLLQRIAPQGAAAVVPNGVDADEWNEDFDAPDWFTRLPSPRALYVGNLQERVDVVALRAMARRRRDQTIVLVGTMLDPEHFAALASEPNVVIHDRVGRRDVVALTRSADVCLVPHRRTRLTEAMSPLKLYEYLAGGRPVVAVDLPPTRLDVPGLVLYREPGNLTDAVDTALAAGPVSEDVRQSFVRANCWERRHDVLLDLALAP